MIKSADGQRLSDRPTRPEVMRRRLAGCKSGAAGAAPLRQGRASRRALVRRATALLLRLAAPHWRGNRRGLRRWVRAYVQQQRPDWLAELVGSVVRSAWVALFLVQMHAYAIVPPPQTQSTSPTANTKNAARTTNVSAAFDQAIQAVDAGTFVLQGGQTGKHSTGGTANTHKAGSFSGAGTSTLTFDPGQDFKPGEQVEVTLTTGLQNTDAVGLIQPYVFRFRAAASSGPAVFDQVTDNTDAATNVTLAVVLGDVDGDGDLDLIIGNSSQATRLLSNDGSGSFTAANIDATSRQTQSVALGDVDGDGDLDLIEGNYFQANRLLSNNGSGSFTAADTDAASNNTRSVMLGDVDGDGDLDLIEGNQGQATRLLSNNGSGSFTAANTDAATNDTRSLVLGDVDGDGDLDFIEGNQDQSNRLLSNNGSGSFTGSNTDAATNKTWSVALGDVDGDGDLDFIEGNQDQSNRLLTNNGSGSFTGANTDAVANKTWSVVLSDVDGDGDLDFIEGSYLQSNRLLSNNGSGSFTAANTDAATNRTYSVTLGDVDGDGDLDLIEGNRSEANRLLKNANPAKLQSSLPTANAKNAVRTTNVSATFNQAIQAVDASKFVLQAGQTGKHATGGTANTHKAGSFSGAGTTTLTFNPGQDFKPGEHVEVTLTTGLQNASAEANQAHVFRFRAAAGSGLGIFTGVDTDAATDQTYSAVLGDVDGDGDLDFIEGNRLQANRLLTIAYSKSNIFLKKPVS